MRLLDVNTFELHEFSGNDVPRYAILSHTWGEDEVTFQDIQSLDLASDKTAFYKIRYTCAQAKVDGLAFAWVDTCCIDKTSSHELSEAINSMFRWYQAAAVCYVYLSDVPGSCPPLGIDDDLHPSAYRYIEAFEDSRWFTRGWTLQELIAPPHVEFFGQAWNFIGALQHMLQRVSGITGVPVDVLDHSRPPSELSVARRLSWAARRKTKRVEDRAYAMLGILDVNMSLLYGEGDKAFVRLQEEIIRQSTDQTIFAWDAPVDGVPAREVLLAPSPECFANCHNMRRRHITATDSAFRMSNKGLEITLPIMRRRISEDQSMPFVTLGILDCKHEGSSDVLALVMSQHPSNQRARSQAMELYVAGYERCSSSSFSSSASSSSVDPSDSASTHSRLVRISPRDIENTKSTLLTITRDLQSLTYIRTFSSNAATWFPIMFVAGSTSSPTVSNSSHSFSLDDQDDTLPHEHAFYPETSWYEASRTLRLKLPESPRGGLVVNTRDHNLVLIAFGVRAGGPNPSDIIKEIYGMCLIDPLCSLQPHVDWLVHSARGEGSEAVGLGLPVSPAEGQTLADGTSANAREHGAVELSPARAHRSMHYAPSPRESLVARMWKGAMRIAKETATEETIDGRPMPSMLSPPSSPLVGSSRGSIAFSQVPGSLERRKSSTTSSSPPHHQFSPPSSPATLRRDSFLDPRSSSSPFPSSANNSPSRSSSNAPRASLHPASEISRVSTCERCQSVYAAEKAKAARRREEQQTRADQKEILRLKTERNRKLLNTAKKASVGLSLGSLVADWGGLADLADVAEFF